MKETIIEKNKAVDKKMGVGIGVNAILFILILTGLSMSFGDDHGDVQAATVPKEEIAPANYPDLTHNNVEDAINHVNAHWLQNMVNDPTTYGTIYLLDELSTEGELFLDHEMGGIIYWELDDGEITVLLQAYSGDIIKYSPNEWTDGSKTQQEIETRAENIINYLCDGIPDDSMGPDIYEETTIQSIGVDVETYEETVTNYDYWYVWYDRIKDATPDLITRDFIKLMITPNGDLAYYKIVWNMDLADVDISYPVSQSEAENTALEYTGEGSSVSSTVKRILRPDYFWLVPGSPLDEGEPVMVYGLEPVAVWNIEIRDANDNLCIYYVHGIENRIVGGDFIYDYYADNQQGA